MEYEIHPYILDADLVEQLSNVLLTFGYAGLAIVSISYLWKTSVNPFTSIRNASFIIGFCAIAYSHYVISMDQHPISPIGYFNTINMIHPHLIEIIKYGNIAILLYAITSIIHVFSGVETMDVAFIEKSILSKHTFLKQPIHVYGLILVHGMLAYAVFKKQIANVSLSFYIMVLLMIYNIYHRTYEHPSIMNNVGILSGLCIAVGYVILSYKNM